MPIADCLEMVRFLNMSQKLPKILVVCGPTASGKTGVGIALAKHFGGEILAADSRTVYRGMDIGTAKPEEDGSLRQSAVGSRNSMLELS